MDAFQVAFRIPNLLRRLFAEGAFAGLRAHPGRNPRPRRRRSRIGWSTRWPRCSSGRCCSPASVGVSRRCWWSGSSAPGLQRLRRRGADDALDVPVHRLHVAGGAVAGILNTWKRFSRCRRRRRCCSTWRHRARPGGCSPLVRAPGHRADLRWRRRRDARRRAATCRAGAGVAAHRLPAAHRPDARARGRLGTRRAARAAPDGAGAAGVSVAQLSLLINADRLAPGRGRGVWLSYADRLMEFPPAAGRGAGRGCCCRSWSAAQAIRRIAATRGPAGLGPAPAAGAALRGGAAGVPAQPWWRCCSTYGAVTPSDVSAPRWR